MFLKERVKNKVKVEKETKNHLSNKRSAEIFYQGLLSGKTEIGDLLFSGSENEESLIKKICSYTGFKYVNKRRVLCKHLYATNKFYVWHYKVK